MKTRKSVKSMFKSQCGEPETTVPERLRRGEEVLYCATARSRELLRACRIASEYAGCLNAGELALKAASYRYNNLMLLRICPICGRLFITVNSVKRTCCANCKRKFIRTWQGGGNRCRSCGEPLDEQRMGRGYCLECYEKLMRQRAALDSQPRVPRRNTYWPMEPGSVAATHFILCLRQAIDDGEGFGRAAEIFTSERDSEADFVRQGLIRWLGSDVLPDWAAEMAEKWAAEGYPMRPELCIPCETD